MVNPDIKNPAGSIACGIFDIRVAVICKPNNKRKSNL